MSAHGEVYVMPSIRVSDALAADVGVAGADAKRFFAEEQLDYALGSTGRSFAANHVWCIAEIYSRFLS